MHIIVKEFEEKQKRDSEFEKEVAFSFEKYPVSTCFVNRVRHEDYFITIFEKNNFHRIHYKLLTMHNEFDIIDT